MYDSTLHARTLGRQIRISDFQPGPLQISLQQRDATIRAAVLVANSGFTSVAFRQSNIGGKPVYQQASLPEALITRHVSENIRRITKVKQSDRQAIVKCIKALSAEGTDFNILKFDVRSFYESINPFAIVNDLRQDAAFSRQSIAVLESFFRALKAQGIVGLPRGFELSATLAEFAMRSFDQRMADLRGVRFYSRYVDDILVISSPNTALEDVQTAASGWLPEGLSFRRNKTKAYEFGRRISAASQLEHEFVFLGYCVKVGQITRTDEGLQRAVTLDIAPNKVRKIKRRIALSLLDYNDAGNFDDLHDRIKMLTSNYEFQDNKTGARRLAGVRYSYSLIDGQKSVALGSLDQFLYNAIYSSNSRNRLRPQLTTQQRRTLFGYSFRSGFLKNRFFAFEQNDLHRISRCWSHA